MGAFSVDFRDFGDFGGKMNRMVLAVCQVSLRKGRLALWIVALLVTFFGPLVWGQATFPGQIGVEVADRPTAFVDGFKNQGRLFIDASGNAVASDASGNPLADGIAVVFDNRPALAWIGVIDDPGEYQPDSSGTYLISFQGQATLSSVSGAPQLVFANQNYNAATNTTTVNVTLPGGPLYSQGQALMEISFTNTQRTASSATNTGISGLQALRPNMPAEAYAQTFGQAGLTANGQIFDPAFIQALAPFGHLRFMGWLGTNSSPGYYGDSGHHLITWDQRSLPTDLYQGVGTSASSSNGIKPGAWGVSWEYVILLANATNKDIWINIPVSATGGTDTLDPAYDGTINSYIYQLATLLKNGNAFTGNVGLKAGLHIYIEHSNEVWNSGFLQYTWNMLAAEDEVKAGGSVLNNDGSTSQYDWAYRRHLKRLYEAGQIFQQVFGAGSLNTTIRPVYAWWQLDEGTSSNAAKSLAWFKSTYGEPSNYFYALAQGDYFDTPNYANDTTVAEVLADMTSASDASVSYEKQNAALATQYGLKLFTYEGGPASDNGGTQTATNAGVQILANRDPGMDALVQHHIRDNWFANGGSNFGYFGLSGAYSRFGDWGATDDYRNLSTAKYNALVNLLGYTNNGVPVAPGALVATAGNGTVALAWQAVPGAASYNIKRSLTTGGPYTTIASGSSPSYNDTAVTNGTTYYYVVTAANSTGESAASNEASAMPVAAVPAAPATLTATAGNGQAALSWSAVAGALSYNIYQGTASGTESATPIATGVTATSYTATGLTNGTTYYFVVAGINVLGTGAVSTEASVTPSGPPPAPANLLASTGDGQVALNWTASFGATSYNVYQGTSAGGEAATPVATGIGSPSYTVSGLTDGTLYYFTVAAVNASGVSGPSNEVASKPAAASNGTLLAYEPFGETSGAVLANASGGGDFGWANAWQDQNGSGNIPGNDVESSTPVAYTGLVENGNYLVGGDYWDYIGRQLDTSATGPFATYLLSNGLIGAPGQTVWMSFLLRADVAKPDVSVSLGTQGGGMAWWIGNPNIEVGYFGSLSNDSSGNPYWSLAYGGSYATPTTVVPTTVPVTAGQPVLCVVGVTFGANGASDKASLYINPTLSGAAPATPDATLSNSSSLAFESLTYYGGTGHNMSSLDEIRVGTSFASVTPQIVVVAPIAPAGLTATSGNGSITLNWTAVAGAASYNVYQGASAGAEGTTPVATGVTGASYTVSGLSNGTTYYFVVSAVNSAGISPASNEASAAPAGPPAVPAGLTATAGNGQITLNWSAAANATGYNVYQGTATGAEAATPIATGLTTTSYTVSGLTNDTAYFYVVTAVNAVGPSANSNEASATPSVPAAGTLLAYEPFGETAGAVLANASGGGDFGWANAWQDQNGSGNIPGNDVESSNPIAYTGLVENGNYLVGGDYWDYIGRQLDVSDAGPFASYLSNGLIGAPGQTVWMSFLLRADVATPDVSFSLGSQGGGMAWWMGNSNIEFGYFGSLSNDANGNPYWSLAYGGSYATPSAVVPTTVPVTAGQPVLFVASITYGASGENSTVNLYLNPTTLGGAAPTTPSATYTTTNSLAFENLTYYGGTGHNMSSLDEIRLGTSFAAVTPAAPVVIPTVPTSLTATPGSGSVTLSWTAVSGATSYKIYQGSSAGAEGTTPVATGVTGTSYTVTGLTNGTTYYFVLAAMNSAGTSAVSVEASATPSYAAGLPAAPVLTASAGNGQATLSWAAIDGATGYNVYQATNAGGEGTTPIATGITGTTYTATGLTNETTYFFEVSATNAVGSSKLSNEVSATPAPPVGGTNAPAIFSIYPQVVAANPGKAGFNMQPAAGANITENSWIVDGGFAPYDERMSLTASQDGSATTFVSTGSGGTSLWESITTGYFVGATARTYRYSGGAWSLLRTDTVAAYSAADDSTAAGNTITFADSGPQILAGDIVWLELDNQATTPGLSLLDPRFTVYCPNWGTETGGGCDSRTNTLPYTLSTDVPTADAGGLSLELSDANTETQGIWQYIQGAFVGSGYEQFQTGHTYKVDVWLKQSGISDGSVTFSIPGLGLSHTFTGVTGAWQQFTWNFAAVAGLPANSAQPNVHLDFNAPGTMWVDNFQLYDAAWAPNTVSPDAMTAWQNFAPGTVRIWSNFGNSFQNYSFFSLDSWLTPEIKTRNTPGIGNQYEVPGELEHLPTALANVKSIGTANPWLIVNMALSETEWSNLIDYLAAPAGVGYAAKRPADHTGPYTDDFSTIYLEVGNEEWGTQQVPADAAYGAWAHFAISNAIAGKSYFDKSKVKFILNGFFEMPSFGSAAIAAAPEVTVVDAALYTQGDQSLSGDAYYQSDLLQVPASNAALIDALVSQQQLDAAAGHSYTLASYEGGPGADTATHNGDTTLAAAIGAIDVNLYAAQSGFGPQNLYMYQLGTGPYTSHTNFANGFRPHPVWEALQMRNNYTSGPMVLTTASSVPTTNDGKAYPLISVYTFRDAVVANQADVVVISRDLSNQTPVTLNFPATPTGTATLYTLTGDPRVGNDTAMNIPIASSTVSGITSSYTFNMPPGSMYLFQVPLGGEWSSTGQPTPAAPAGLSASADNGEVTLTWTASTGATSYNVLSGVTTGGPYTQIATSATVAYTDSTVTNGTTYYYVVQAVNSGGVSGNSAEASATPNVETAAMANSAPPLDGSDTGAWANLAFVPIEHQFQGASTDTAGYKVLWDANNLYVLVSVQDSYLIAPTEANIWSGETVELYFSGTDSKSTTYGLTDFQYAFPYGNGGATITESYHSPASLKNVTYAQQAIDGGFQMAIAMPWTTLGTTPVAGQQYGFDLMIDTASAQGTRQGKLAWWATSDGTWGNPSLMGPLVLGQAQQTAQTISFTAPSTATYGSTIALSATASSGLAPAFTVVSGPATLNGSQLTFTGVGSVVVQASQSGNSSFAAATPVTQTIAVAKAALSIAADNFTRTYGAPNPAFTGSVSGAVNGDTFTLSFTTTATDSSTAGSYPIVPAAAGANLDDYDVSVQNGTLTIQKATPTISWATPAAITYGTALSGTQLNATSTVAGTFVYSPASGAVLAVGTQTLSTILTPTDTTDYTTATATVQLTVNTAPNPLPVIASLTPAIGSAGGAAFTLTVNGTGFTANSTINWGASALATTFVGSTQLTALVPAADMATAGATAITVQTPAPGGGTSNSLQFQVDTAGSSSTAPTFTTLTATVAAGSTASYAVTLPSTVTSASVTCLNVPAGAACSYSSATNTVTITTSTTTPKGTYQITVVFTETVSGAATSWILLPILLLPLVMLRRKLAARGIWLTASLGVVLLAAAAFSIGCGGSGSKTTPQTHQATSSGSVTLTVQ
jgi:fibronectin type 3 domain-containing protein